MKSNKLHIDLIAIDRESKAFFSEGKIGWGKSEADIWADMEAVMAVKPKGRFISLNFTFSKWLAAASILVLFSLAGFMRFYTINIESPIGLHQETILPDHSVVNLNAQSSISYNPYWWMFSRKVKLAGEAFFEVQKGKKFSVESNRGITQVLGTSFNIYSREDIYKVTCITGTVKVTSKSGFEAVIHPNSKAEITENGEIQVINDIETFPEISWKKNIFLFTATPVHSVFKEIERQYGVSIDTRNMDESLYTGNFVKNQNVEEILDYVCPALGLKYVRKSAGSYLIMQKEETKSTE